MRYTILLFTTLFLIACAKENESNRPLVPNQNAGATYCVAGTIYDSTVHSKNYISTSFSDNPNGATGAISSCVSDYMSYFFVINSAASTKKYNFFLNNLAFATNNHSYLDITNYYGVYHNKYNFSVVNTSSNQVIAEKVFNFEKNKSYSLFIADTGNKTSLIQILDKVSRPQKDSVKIRFANMSPNLPSLDFYNANSGEIIATHIRYTEATQFISLKATNNLVFDIYESGTKKFLARSSLTSLYALNYYTVMASGYNKLNSTDGKLRVETIKHF